MSSSLPNPQRRHRFNYFACLTDVIGFSLGILFFNPDTLLPAFVSRLSPDKIWVGIVTAINISGFFLPQLLAASWVQRLTYKRIYVLTLALVERAAIFSIVPLLLFHNSISAITLLTIFCLFFALHTLCMGCNGPAYFDLISKVIPTRQRGVMYGVGAGIGGLFGLGGMVLTGYLIQRFDFPYNYASCFFLGAIVLTISVIPLGFIDEPPSTPSDNKQLKTYFAEALDIFMTDRNFRFYLVSQAFLSAFPTAIPFLTVLATETVAASELQIVWFTGILSAGRILGQPVWGYISDQRGNSIALVFNIFLAVIAVGLVFFAKSIWIFYLIFSLVSISQSGLEIPSMNITLEFAKPENVPTYVALRAAIIAPFRALLPICTGPLISGFGYQRTFGILTIMILLSWLCMLQVKEPRSINKIDINK